jgi:POT family proton-dependent oligopeptide transporter
MAATVNTKASLEITKGATALDPIPLDVSESNSFHDEDERLLGPFPTDEEWATLPRVPGRIPWTAWTVASVEFVERFSYYGTSAVFVNFIQKKLPPGSKTGAGFLKKPGSGALNMGQRASTGMTTCESCLNFILRSLLTPSSQPVLVLLHTIVWCLDRRRVLGPLQDHPVG